MLLRRKLSADAVAKWEQAFGPAWQWFQGRAKENYAPGEMVRGSRCEFPREPYLSKALPCYLCGLDFDCKAALVQHWRRCHVDVPDDEAACLSDHRIEEEMRKRVFYKEAFQGPYEVRGQEMRHIIGNRASHQTCSAPSSGCINHSGGRPKQRGRWAVAPYAAAASGAKICTTCTCSRGLCPM